MMVNMIQIGKIIQNYQSILHFIYILTFCYLVAFKKTPCTKSISLALTLNLCQGQIYPQMFGNTYNSIKSLNLLLYPLVWRFMVVFWQLQQGLLYPMLLRPHLTLAVLCMVLLALARACWHLKCEMCYYIHLENKLFLDSISCALRIKYKYTAV